MKKAMVLTYGVIAYFAFFAAMLYLIGFVGNLWVPKGIDDGTPIALSLAITINVLLILAFAVQHTIMARPAFKRWWTQYVPEPMERSTFVLATSVMLAVMYWQWRPIPAPVWAVEGGAAKTIFYAAFAFGWFLVFYSSFLINHFDLFGLRQVVLHFTGRPYTHVPTKVVSLYRYVRNPLMLGLLIAFWFTPTMTVGHLLFAGCMTAYILIGIQFEERTLSNELGEVYRAYRRRTPMLIPIPGRAAGPRVDETGLDVTVEGK